MRGSAYAYEQKTNHSVKTAFFTDDKLALRASSARQNHAGLGLRLHSLRDHAALNERADAAALSPGATPTRRGLAKLILSVSRLVYTSQLRHPCA